MQDEVIKAMYDLLFIHMPLITLVTLVIVVVLGVIGYFKRESLRLFTQEHPGTVIAIEQMAAIWIIFCIGSTFLYVASPVVLLISAAIVLLVVFYFVLVDIALRVIRWIYAKRREHRLILTENTKR